MVNNLDDRNVPSVRLSVRWRFAAPTTSHIGEGNFGLAFVLTKKQSMNTPIDATWPGFSSGELKECLPPGRLAGVFLERVPIAFARRRLVLGLESDNDSLPVAVASRDNRSALGKLSVLLGVPPRLVMVGANELLQPLCRESLPAWRGPLSFLDGDGAHPVRGFAPSIMDAGAPNPHNPTKSRRPA